MAVKEKFLRGSVLIASALASLCFGASASGFIISFANIYI